MKFDMSTLMAVGAAYFCFSMVAGGNSQAYKGWKKADDEGHDLRSREYRPPGSVKKKDTKPPGSDAKEG